MSEDFVIVGAGIVGLSVARELRKRHPGARITVLEKEPAPGRHASGRNSGVLHSGIYYPPQTLKAKLCAKGGAMMREFARERGVRCDSVGKVIAARSEADLPRLDALLVNAREAGIRAEKVDEAGLRTLEPHARTHRFAIHVPDTAVIDSPGLVRTLARLIQEQDVSIRLGEQVLSISENVVFTNTSQYSFKYLFNCAGAYADRVAASMGLGRRYTLVPFKGLYWKLRPDRRHLVAGNLYPVPDPRFPFLGVHFTRGVHGDVYVGPTAIPALGRENYGVVAGIRPAEAAGILARLARMYVAGGAFRRLVHEELLRYWKPRFTAAARSLVPELRSEDLVPCDKVGIRPQLIDLLENRLEMDFVIEQDAVSLHVLNAISPAFTSAFAFAEWIVDRAGLGRTA